MLIKTLVAHHRPPMSRAGRPPGVPRTQSDGGAGQVHGPAWVRLEPLASGRDAAAPGGARGESLS